MDKYHIFPSILKGAITTPPSKSHTLRAILFASLAHGTSSIQNYLLSPDAIAMIEAVRLIGATVSILPHKLIITGCSGKPHTPTDIIQCGNSGIVLRFMGALAGLLPGYTILTGDESIRHRRPVGPLIDALTQLGAFATPANPHQHAPLIIKGPLTHNFAAFDGQDSQPVSAMLIAASFAPHPIELSIRNAGEKPWIDVTIDWLRRLKIKVEREEFSHYYLSGQSQIEAFEYIVPGDFSSAAFPIAAALLTGSEITVQNIDMNDCQGDKIVISILQEMGAKFEINHLKRHLIVKPSTLHGIKIDVNDCIDALPILAVVGCLAHGRTELRNASIARKKESDRIHAMTVELSKMGAKIQERKDGLVIDGSELNGSSLFSHYDHRIALSLSIAALAAKSESTIDSIECINKSYPDFLKDFQSIQARIES